MVSPGNLEQGTSLLKLSPRITVALMFPTIIQLAVDKEILSHPTTVSEIKACRTENRAVGIPFSHHHFFE